MRNRTFFWCIPLTVLLSFSLNVEGQVGFPGACPKIRPMQNFNLTEYLGTWYEYSNYFSIQQEGARCVEAVYEDNGDGTIRVTNIQIGLLNNEMRTVGRGTLVAPLLGDGRLKITFFPFSAGAEFLGFIRDGNYWVLDTDYDSYSVVWSCTNLGLYNFQNLWILTRERHPPKSVFDKAIKVVTDNRLDETSLRGTPQENCVITS